MNIGNNALTCSPQSAPRTLVHHGMLSPTCVQALIATDDMRELELDCERWATQVDTAELDAALAALDAGRKSFEKHAEAELENEVLTHVVGAPAHGLSEDDIAFLREDEALREIEQDCEWWATQVDTAELDAALAALDAERKSDDALVEAEMEQEMARLQASETPAPPAARAAPAPPAARRVVTFSSCRARPAVRYLPSCRSEEQRQERWSVLLETLDELGHTTRRQAVEYHTRAMGVCC